MKLEKLEHDKSRKRVIGVIGVVAVLSIGVFAASLAKYRSTKSINIAKGTVNYSPADLDMVAVYVEADDGSYTKVTDGKIPSSGYTLNTDSTKTRCTVNGEIDSNIKLGYDNGELEVGGVTKSGTKCYFYFDIKPNAADVIPGGNDTDDSMFAGITGDGVYTWTKGDYSGGSQPIKYYRGNVSNNWVVFGKDGSNYIWWRIIRNNSNGSLRMIYAGTSSSKTSAPSTTGTGTQIGTSAFNSSSNNNMYVGFKYTSGQVHGTGTSSTILGQLDSWYNRTLAKSVEYSSKIDVDAGFCNDRTPHSGSGTGTTYTEYAAFNRLYTNKAPSLLCTNADDIFKTNVGLITADEVSMGGMVYRSPVNTSSYLYTNSYYWTMSPFSSDNGDGLVVVFYVDLSGSLGFNDAVYSAYSVRPVINLKSDTLFEEGGTGTNTNPYVAIGT